MWILSFFVMKSYKLSTKMIGIDILHLLLYDVFTKYNTSSSGQGDRKEFPTGGKVRDPPSAADLVICASRNSKTDSKVWMREEKIW